MEKEAIRVLLADIKEVNNGLNANKDSGLNEKIASLMKSRSKHFDEMKSTVDDLIKERNSLQAEVNARKEILNDLLRTKEMIAKVNEGLKSSEHNLKRKGMVWEDKKTLEDIKFKLKLYQKITGVQFDFNAPKDVVSGYARMKSEVGKSMPVPFILSKSESNLEDKLWQKIQEACRVEEKENVDIADTGVH